MSDEQRGYPGAPPGWYPDPAGGPSQRWWDGYAWSDAVAAPAPPLGAAPPWAVASARLTTATTSSLVHTELSMTPVARIALAFPAISSFVILLFIRVNATEMRTLGHQFHRAYLAAENNQPAPVLQIPSFNSGMNSLLSIDWFVLLGALIISLIWQHRAASAARALGLPARHSPAWGVGSWFVPVANLFIPYQALADCLPIGDVNRSLVRRYWLCGIGSGLCIPAAVAAACFDATASLVLSIPAALLTLGVLALAPGVVTSIATAHRAALEQVDHPSPAGV